MNINTIYLFIRKRKIRLFLFIILAVGYYFCLPKKLFKKPYATVIESKEGKLLGAKIADDGQWRFPERDSVPYKFEKALLQYEDKHFYWHWGVNPVSIGKALVQNFRSGKIVRGGSTVTQQVIRLSRGNKQRSYWEKCIEIVLATRLEFRHSKQKILALYASHAPFGGNVVGIDMASWRYFGVSPEQLSWSENALLAVLPNAPGLIHLGKNQQKLKEKRDALLLKLHQSGEIDAQTYELSLLEPLPENPQPLPQLAPHLTEKMAHELPQKRTRTTIDFHLQSQLNRICKRYYNLYKQFEVHNMAILVVDVQKRHVIGYVGNTPTDEEHQKDVNIIHAPRSTGSILKPFLYGAMLDSGELLPEEFIADVPTRISEYTPENFNKTFEGAVPANEALSKSLNIPFVLLLQRYGVYRFYEQLQKYQLKTIKKHPDHYGLSLILGGAESNLWELTQAYTNMVSDLNYFNKKRLYHEFPFQKLQLLSEEKALNYGKDMSLKQFMSAGAIWQTFQAMTEVNRPVYDAAWTYYESSQRIAWKTGTSFGNRDGWAIGLTPRYVVGVWVGNAKGEGRPHLTGANNASPILFEVFGLLPKSTWFSEPIDDLEEVSVCAVSGFLASEYCPKKVQKVVANLPHGNPCSFHKLVHLTPDRKFQVNTTCESLGQIVTENRFVLPPVMEWFYKKNHVNYQSLPPFRPDCVSSEKQRVLDFIYPKHGNILQQSKDFGSKIQPIIAKVAYTGKGKIFWYLDDVYLGETLHFHEKPFEASKGNHYLKVLDTQGNEKTILITVL